MKRTYDCVSLRTKKAYKIFTKYYITEEKKLYLISMLLSIEGIIKSYIEEQEKEGR